jgi:hypothetical protein
MKRSTRTALVFGILSLAAVIAAVILFAVVAF